MTFTKQGPKRRRCTRRDKLREGQVSQYRSCWTNFKREREARIIKAVWRANA